MSGETDAPQREGFFASRGGVCVYVTVMGQTVRVCFESLDARGKVEAALLPSVASQAIAIAEERFAACRESLEPLFEQIAEASGPGLPPSR